MFHSLLRTSVRFFQFKAFHLILIYLPYFLPTVFGFGVYRRINGETFLRSRVNRGPPLLRLANPDIPVPSIVEIPPDFVTPTRGIILVDPFSKYHSGYMMDLAIHNYGVGVVRVISPYIAKGLTSQQHDVRCMIAPLESPALKEWLEQIPFEIQAVICESDSGLSYAEKLACALEQEGILLHHNRYLQARRDKFAMNEMCRLDGIDVVAQTLCKSVEESIFHAKTFGCLDDSTTSIPVIIKPRRGVASDRVSLCRTLNEVPGAVEAILNSTVFGTYNSKHTNVLLQEYVDGTEYAIDIVSKDGVHKVAALWVYDKTSTSEDGTKNPFAYLSGKLVSTNDPLHACLPAVMDYVEECLTALDIRWGMSHTEIKVQIDGRIRLIEVNARQQNDNFGPLCDACLGYNAMDMCLSAYLEEDGIFEAVPSRPILRLHGMIVNLACFVEGTVSAIHHLDRIEELESVEALEIYPGFDIGQLVRRTKDIRSDCGWVHLVNESEDNMMDDYKKICKWMPSIFDVE